MTQKNIKNISTLNSAELNEYFKDIVASEIVGNVDKMRHYRTIFSAPKDNSDALPYAQLPRNLFLNDSQSVGKKQMCLKFEVGASA